MSAEVVEEVGVQEYEGSLLLIGVADAIKIPIDQVNFFASQLVALIVALVYRKLITDNVLYRHLFGCLLGLGLLYFCYGVNTLHAIVLPAICYVIIRTQSAELSHISVLIVAMSYLCLMHLHRIYYNYGFSGVDISGPIMVMVQKITSLAFSVHDGLVRKQEEMSEMQKKLAQQAMPTPIQFFSYLLLFPSLLAGPVIHFKDYIDFIEGNDKSSDYSPNKAVFNKVIVSLACCAVFVLCKPYFTIGRLKEEQFLTETDFSYKLWYISVCTNLVRFKYYFAWIMADAICNNCGIGFNGLDEEGNPKWDKVSNVDIVQFEFATSLKEAIEGWNKGTNVWLRFVIYERVSKLKVLLTYGISALWHGFYPGYYITFFTGALFTYASRIVRKNVRNYFVSNQDMKKLYDVCTFIVTRCALAYATFPFILYEFWATMALYNKLYYHLHIASILTILLVPNCLPRTLAANPVKNEENVKIVKALRSGSYRID